MRISTLHTDKVKVGVVCASALSALLLVLSFASLTALADEVPVQKSYSDSLAASDEDAPSELTKTWPEMTDEDYESYLDSLGSDTPANPRRHIWNSVTPYSLVATRAYDAPYWSSISSEKAFYSGDGLLFACPANKVIDVSEWNGTSIDWARVKNDGVDAAILRIGYWTDTTDKAFSTNVRGVRANGISYGVYLYSYAYDVDTARGEATNTANILDAYGCSDMSYPIFYDLEDWEGQNWGKIHPQPSSPSEYEPIVRAYVETLAARGYTNVRIYTGRSYLQNELNSPYLWSLSSWIAEYYSKLQASNPYINGQLGWQYTSSGVVDGISGKVDLSAFTEDDYDGVDLSSLGTRVDDIKEGNYFIRSMIGSRYLDIDNAQTNDGASALIWSPNNASNQLFHITPLGNGEYSISSVRSGKLLDAYEGRTRNGTSVIQWTSNGGDNQRWRFYRSDQGYLYIVSVKAGSHNKVLSVSNNSDALGTGIVLWAAEGKTGQQFCLQQAIDVENDAEVSLTSASSGRVLSTKRSSMEEGAFVATSSDEGLTSQRFKYEYVGNGAFKLLNINSGLYVGVNGDSFLKQVSDASDSSNWWYVSKSGSGYNLVRYSDNTAVASSDGGKLECVSINSSNGGLAWSISKNYSTKTSPKYGWLNDGQGNLRWFENDRVSDYQSCEKYDDATDSWYWINADGSRLDTRVVWNDAGNKWVYYDSRGKMAHGEARLDYDAEHTGWYYFDDITGAMRHGVTRIDAGQKWVYYDIWTGIMAHGEAYLNYDAEHTGWYYFDNVTGAMFHGDKWLADGSKWVRYDHSTGIMVHGLQRWDGSWYYFDQTTGKMAHGNSWVPEWNSWHWFDSVTGRG